MTRPMADTATGVVGMLEVVESDFKRLDAETTADEMQAAHDYNAFMTDAQKSKAVKTAKKQLYDLIEFIPEDKEGIEAARVRLDAAKVANGAKESDCFQSAEAAFKNAG